MYRRWRVRHSYPTPVVELVALLMSLHAVREISRMLDIPKSVIYRWRAQNRSGSSAAVKAHDIDTDSVATLIGRCEALGFRFAEGLCAASGPVASALRAAQQRPNEAAPRVRELDERVAADAFASPLDAKESGSGNPSNARRERPSRAVRSRLEAVRLMIDTEYYLDFDSHTLAETARMSRHHFIRMFSRMFGMSPHQYLTRARIGAAKKLLLASREPIEVIAAGVGFRSGPSLNRAFKQIEGAGASKYSQTANRNGFDTKPARAVPASGAGATLQRDE